MGCVYVPSWFNGLMVIVLFLFITLALTFVTVLYGFRHVVRDNWGKYRCDPFVMPFTRFFMDVEPVDNFKKCVSRNVKETSGPILTPYNDILSSAAFTSAQLLKSVRDATRVVDTGRTNMTIGLSDVLGKMGNIATTTEFLMIKIKTVFQKVLTLYLSLLYAAWSIMKGIEAMVKDPVVKNAHAVLDKAMKL